MRSVRAAAVILPCPRHPAHLPASSRCSVSPYQMSKGKVTYRASSRCEVSGEEWAWEAERGSVSLEQGWGEAQKAES